MTTRVQPDLRQMDVSDRRMASDAARAVGRFKPNGPDGYKAATMPDAPLRATRDEAFADERRHLTWGGLTPEQVRQAFDAWEPTSPADVILKSLMRAKAIDDGMLPAAEGGEAA